MGTTRDRIGQWFDQGVQKKALFMIVGTDTFDHTDYPRYCMTAEEALSEHKRINEGNMSRVMEVYDLNADKAEQMAETRTWRLPKPPGPLGTVKALAESFEANNAHHCKFEELSNPASKRSDLVAFMLLDSLVPEEQAGRKIIIGHNHDEVFLGINCEALAKVITDAQVKDLLRCGITYDTSHACLAMFV